MPGKNKLTERRRKCLQLIHAGKSYPDAYMASHDTTATRTTANKRVCEMLKIPECAAYLDSLREKATDNHQALIAKVVAKLEAVIDFDIRRLYHDDGRVKQPHELDDATAAAIAGFKSRRVRTRKTDVDEEDIEEFLEEYKAIDAMKATEQLGRYTKMFAADKDAGTGEPFHLHIHL